MAKSDREKIGQAMMLFKSGLKPFVKRELKSHLGDNWKTQVECCGVQEV